jgi:hypothetical protein
MIAATKGFVRRASLILAVSLPLISTQAHAVTVTVNGTSYELSNVTGSFNNADTQLLQGQVWWGNSSLALDFATAFSANASSPLNVRSYFAFGFNSDPEIIDAAYAVRYIGGVENVISGAYRSQTERYMTATLSPSSVPEINAGSLSQALLILFALWLVTWRRTGSRVA